MSEQKPIVVGGQKLKGIMWYVPNFHKGIERKKDGYDRIV
jgi:hypothetical protein